MEGRDGSRWLPDPTQEWPPDPKHDDDTSLQEAMWQLRLGSRGEHDPDPDPGIYPNRPHEADCIYYSRTGFCGHGTRCRFNHPLDRALVPGAPRAGSGELPERIGQPVCQFYMRTGSCKFGSLCKYNHPRQGANPDGPVQLNYYGYPYRPEEKECSYYMKTGQCKFGGTCKFHHPQPASVPVATPAPFPMAPLPPPIPSSQQYGVLVTRPSFIQSPYGPMLLPPGIAPFTGYAPYQASVSSVASSSPQAGSGSNSVYGISQISSTVPALAGPKEQLFPERPGQPECQHYLKTGYCKYGSSCRYHHPPETNALHTSVVLNPHGLPLRPGMAPHMHFAHGECKFGPACKYEHSMGALSYNSLASSVGDASVIPYPTGLPYMTTPDAFHGAIIPNMVSVPFPTSQRLSQDSTSSPGTRNGDNNNSGGKGGAA